MLLVDFFRARSVRATREKSRDCERLGDLQNSSVDETLGIYIQSVKAASLPPVRFPEDAYKRRDG